MQIKKMFKSFFLFFMAPASMLWGAHIGFTESAISTSADYAVKPYSLVDKLKYVIFILILFYNNRVDSRYGKPKGLRIY